MADLHHRPRSVPKTAKPLILLAIVGSVPNSLDFTARAAALPLTGWRFCLHEGFGLPTRRF